MRIVKQLIIVSAAMLMVVGNGAYAQKQWSIIGSGGFNTDAVLSWGMSLDVYKGTPYIAYCDFPTSGKAAVMKYNGTNWVYVGTKGFSAGGAYHQSFAIDNSGTPYIAYQGNALILVP